MNPIISAIIPVYNSEQYLRACIDSVLGQFFNDFELLLVNDGSTDSSGKICDEYALKDARVRVFHKENGGASSARNLGIENACGEWICFIDSDDKISHNYFNLFKTDLPYSDIIFVGIDKIDQNKVISRVRFIDEMMETSDFLNKYTLFSRFAGPVGKFYKATIIQQNQLQFNEKIHNGEDGLFNLSFLVKSQKVYFDNDSIYYYLKRENSLSSRKINLLEGEQLYNAYLEVMELNSFSHKDISRHMQYVVAIYLFSILNSDLSFKNKKEKLELLANRFIEIIVDHLKGTLYTRFISFLLVNEQYTFVILLASCRKLFI